MNYRLNVDLSCTSRLSRQDWRTVALILALTVAAFVFLGLLVLVTPYTLRTQDAVMVMSWLIGATMTLAWVRRAEWFGKGERVNGRLVD